ncbi:putative transferase [Helianthus anomalus]
MLFSQNFQHNSLDLSGNELGGMIPPSIAALTFLSYLNLSNNNLSGQILTGNQLQTLIDPSIYAGNKDLCGPPLPKNCSNPDDPTITPNKKYEASHDPNKVWFYVDIMCGYATGFWGVIVVLILKKQWRHKLFMFADESMYKIHVAIMVTVNKMRIGRGAI